MEPPKTWLLLVDHNFGAIGNRFSVRTFDDIADLKVKVKEKGENDLKNIDAANLTVWRTKGTSTINKSTSKRLVEILRDIRVNDKDTIEELSEDEVVVDLGLSVGETLLVRLPGTSRNSTAPETYYVNLVLVDRKHVHLAITIDNEGASMKRIPELKEFSRYNKTVKTQGESPSEGAKSTRYREIQGDATQAIYDGRWAEDGIISTRSPPIQIFHPIFSDFIRLIDHPDVQPTVDDLKSVYDFMFFASEVDRWEGAYSEGVCGRLKSILVGNVREETIPEIDEPDGVITLQIGKARIMHLVIELKRELGEGGCDPSTQVSLSMRRSWIHSTRETIRERCCCPTFLVAAGGPWLSVLGGVFTDRFIVQRLTDVKWMGLSSTAEDDRVYHNAKVLVALRNCLAKLVTFYMNLQDTPPLVANEPHPRYFPYPTSFIAKDGSTTRFRYLGSLEEDATCVTYLAEILNEADATENPVKVVVKFVARYGKEVHEFLAGKSRAPTLRYSGPIPGIELSCNFPGLAQSPPPGLRLRSNLMQMVVMDYIGAQPNTPPDDVRGQIQTILTLLHSEGYVFGDLRRQNILFDAYGKVKLIDFDWCGRYDMSIRDDNLPDDLKSQIDKNIGRVQAGDEGYAYYPLSMSTVEGMWAPGMEPLAQIRPIHDWMMLDKLSWE